MGTDVVKNVNKNNASHAVLFEALALVSIFFYILGISLAKLWEGTAHSGKVRIRLQSEHETTFVVDVDGFPVFVAYIL